ncbi:MAG TPA: MBL fold metallo-hydrolase, partial [Polyangiaceae bacterium]|nr:MBL fold metallo-hydrolase [Polyangiaceae bacterium]
ALEPARLGVPSSSEALEAVIDIPGPVEVETVRSARWSVTRAGLINLDDPKAEAAGLEDGPEPIEVYFHALRHPTRGVFILDTGVERAFASDPEHAAVRGWFRSLSGVGTLQVEVDLASWLERQPAPLGGVFLSHLHLDHVLGLPDVPPATPLYVGPGEAGATGFMNMFTQSITDRMLEQHAPLSELRFEPDPSQRFAGVLDVFADGSVWALHVPGHTPGSMAFVARTPRGPVLLTSDACHTRFGWENEVEPGTFSSDGPLSEQSLAALEQLAARHPALDVRLGHQALPPRQAGALTAAH